MMTVEPRRGVTAYEPREGAPVFLSDMIIELGLAEAAHVDAAVDTARSSGETVGHILVREGRLTEDQLARALAARYGLNHIDLNDFEVDPAAANLLPPASAQRYHAVPVAFEPDGGLLVAMADPSDSLALNDIAFMTHLEVRAAVAAETLIAQLVAQLPLAASEGGGSPFTAPAPAPDFAPQPEPEVDPREEQLAALRAELEAANAALDSERSKHAESVAGLRGELDGLRAELESAQQQAAQASESRIEAAQLDEAERRVNEAHSTVERMRREFELEREQHAATERDLRARLASETERHEALQEAQASLQKRMDALRAQNAALLDAYATAKRWSAEFARGARELADTLEQPVLDDAVRAQQSQTDPPTDAAPREGGTRFSREDDEPGSAGGAAPEDWPG